MSRSCLNALESVGTLAEEVPEASRERINACDILLHLGVDEALKYNDDDWDDPLRHEIEQLEDADEIAVAEEINAAIPHSQDVFLGVEIQDGLTFTTRILFDSNLPAEAGSWLEDLAIEDGGSRAGSTIDTRRPAGRTGDGRHVLTSFDATSKTHRADAESPVSAFTRIVGKRFHRCTG